MRLLLENPKEGIRRSSTAASAGSSTRRIRRSSRLSLLHLAQLLGLVQEIGSLTERKNIQLYDVISGAKGPRARIMDLCPLVPGLRAVDGGPLSNARIVEEMTALLIGLNIRYKLPEGLGLRFTGLPEAK